MTSDVSRLIRVLSAPVADGLAFVRDLQKALDEAGCDLRSLVTSTPFAPEAPQAPQAARNPKQPLQEQAAELLKHPEIIGVLDGRLDSAWHARELSLLNNVVAGKFTASAKTRKWLNDIDSRRRRTA